MTMVAMMVAFVTACEPLDIYNNDYLGFAVEGYYVYAYHSEDDGEMTVFKLNPIRVVETPDLISDTTKVTDVGLVQINKARLSSTQSTKVIGTVSRDKNIEIRSEVFTAKMSVPVEGAEDLQADFSFIKEVVYLLLEDEELSQELDFSYTLNGVPVAVERTDEGYLNYKYKFTVEIFESEYSLGTYIFERYFAVSPTN